MPVEHANQESGKVESKGERAFLEGVGKKLVAAGLRVNWSVNSWQPALVIDESCLIRSTFPEAMIIGTFLGSENTILRARIEIALGERVMFSGHCFDLGGLSIGESIT